MRTRLAVTALALAAVLLTSGCGQEPAQHAQDDAGRSTAGEVTPSGTGAPALPSTAPADSSPRTVEAKRHGATAAPARLADVRVTAHDAFDRIRFEFSGGVSKVFAEYMEELREPGRGKRIPLAGEHTLVLVFVGVARQDPALRTDSTSTVREIRASGVFEGEMIVGLGLDSEGDGPAGYRVEADGTSVTVDIAHQASPASR